MSNRALLVRVLLLAALVSAMPLAGCSGEVSYTSAKLSEAAMCLGVDGDAKPVNPTSAFAVNTPEIFCSVKLSNAPADTEIGSEWVYVRGELSGYDNTVIDTLVLPADGTQYLQFSLPRPDGGWPTGEYKLKLYIDGKEKVSLPFTVSKTAAGSGKASLSQATMCLGVDAQSKPVDPTSTFPRDVPEIFCSVLISDAPAGTQAVAEWYYVSGDLAGVTNALMDSVGLAVEGTQYAVFSLTPPDQGWSGGQYQLKLFLNGALQEAVPFSVESAPITATMSVSIDAKNQPVNPTSTFPVGTDKVWTIIFLHNVPAGSKLLVEWYEVGGAVDRYLFKYETTTEVRELPYGVNATGGTGGWKKGTYAVVISLNGERQVVLPFTVA